LSHANIDLPKLQAEFAKLFPPDLVLAGGSFTASVDGSYDQNAKKAVISGLSAGTKGVSIQKKSADGTLVDVLKNYSLAMETTASVDMTDGIAARVPKLSVTDST